MACGYDGSIEIGSRFKETNSSEVLTHVYLVVIHQKSYFNESQASGYLMIFICCTSYTIPKSPARNKCLISIPYKYQLCENHHLVSQEIVVDFACGISVNAKVVIRGVLLVAPQKTPETERSEGLPSRPVTNCLWYC